jgi:ribosomal protein S18 acetylase RimI-like enzyme
VDPSPTVVRLNETAVPQAAAVLARAFADDPLFVVMVPDYQRRQAMLPPFMAAAVCFCQRFGEVYATGGALRGVAAWSAPGEASTRERWMAAGFGAAMAAMDDAAVSRMIAIFEHQGAFRERAMPEPYWYLIVLGVEPADQGHGLGGRLLQPILARADAERLPCYLETESADAVRFYTRHGFAVLVEDDVPGVGFHYWAMHRPPVANADDTTTDRR